MDSEHYIGMFVTFEGIEGCGKSTQIGLLASYLSTSGTPHILTREPGGSSIGREIRKILLGTENRIAGTAELLLYAADRAQHVEEVIIPAIDKGEVVLCDRFSDATTAYQGYGRGLEMGLIKKLNDVAAQDIRPDLTFLIDCPAEVGIRRALERSSSENPSEMRFEKENISFHMKVKDGYRKVLESDPARVVMINGDRAVEDVHSEVLSIFIERMAGKNGGNQLGV